MNAFTTSIIRFFSMITTWIGVLDKIATTADNIATVGVEASATYVDNTRHDRNMAQIERQKQLKLITQEAAQ